MMLGGRVDVIALKAELLSSSAGGGNTDNEDGDDDAPLCKRCGANGHLAAECDDAKVFVDAVNRRAHAARVRFRRAMMENFRALPLTNVERLESDVVDVQYWVYAPTKAAMDAAEKASGKRSSSGNSSAAADDLLRSAIDAFGTALDGATLDKPTSEVVDDDTTSDDERSTSDESSGDATPSKARQTMVPGDAEWAADAVSSEDGSLPSSKATHGTGSVGDTRHTSAVHVDRQNASGIWPHPVFLRIERVLVQRAKTQSVSQVIFILRKHL